MRKIILSSKDFDLFNTDITLNEYEFMQRHWDAFRRMWMEQGNKFWIKFIVTFRNFAGDYGLINDPKLTDRYTDIIDEAFIFLHENFIESKYRGAKNLMEQILFFAENKALIHNLGQKSVRKDPFFNKDTRDCFRFLFGNPSERISYLKACLLHDIFTRFGGAVCKCLRRWLEAREVDPNDEFFWSPAATASEPAATASPAKPCAYCKMLKGSEPPRKFVNNDMLTFCMEKHSGQPCGPWFVPAWPLHEDPRFTDPRNPLYDLNSDPEEDWRNTVTYNKFVSFMTFVRQYYDGEDLGEELTGEHRQSLENVQPMLDSDVGRKILEKMVSEQGSTSEVPSTIPPPPPTEDTQPDAPSPAHTDSKKPTTNNGSQQKTQPGDCKPQSKIQVKEQTSKKDKSKSLPPGAQSENSATPSEDELEEPEMFKPLRAVLNMLKAEHEALKDAGKTSSDSEDGIGTNRDCVAGAEAIAESAEKSSNHSSQSDVLSGCSKSSSPSPKDETSGHSKPSSPSLTDKTKSSSTERRKKVSVLRVCARCEEEEPAPHTYKMCPFCKEDFLADDVRRKFYCDRSCQVLDWRSRHKFDHSDVKSS